jgi:hypothetical protein
MEKTIDNFSYYRSPWGGRWSGQATLKPGTDSMQFDSEYLLIEISESNNPWDENGHERFGASNEPPTGVLVFGSVQVRKKGAYGSEKIYKPAQMYIRWFGQDELDLVKLALVEMLEELVDAINPPAEIEPAGI